MKRLLIFLLSFSAGWILMGQSAITEEIPFDEQTIVGKLDNGFTYYIKKNQKPENFAEVRLAVNAGSVLETEAQQGLAHFVEHMCFNGTKNFPGNGVVDYLQKIGSRFGAHVNAFTSFEETVYMLRLPTDEEEKFKNGLQIMNDWAHQVTFEDEEIDKERGVIVEEWRTGQGPQQRMNRDVLPVIFYKSKYAERLPIGKLDILKSFEYQTLKDFYYKWYRPDNMALVVVGDVNVAMTEAFIKEKFGQIKQPQEPLEIPTFDMPDHEEVLVETVTDPEAPYNVMQVLFKQAPRDVLNMEDYRASIVRSLAVSMLGLRLSEASEEPDAPFSFVGSGYGALSSIRVKDAFQLFAIFPEGKALPSLEKVLEETRRAEQFGFTQSELDRIKTSTLSNLEKRYNERDKTNSRRIVMDYVYHFLENSPVPGIKNELEMHKEVLPKVDLAAVNEAIKQLVVDNNQVVVMTGPEKEGNEFPSEEEIKSAILTSSSAELTAYEDNVAEGPLMEDMPEPGSVTSTRMIEEIGVTELTLSNRVKVVLKPTDFQNDQVVMRAVSEGGNSLYGEENYMSAAFSDALVGSSGLGEFDNTQLQKYLSDKQLNLSPYVGELSEGMNGSFSPEDAETFFQLLHLYFTKPKIEEKVFQSTMARYKGIFPTLLNVPEQWFSNAVSEYLYDNNIRRKGIFSIEAMDQVDREKALEIFKERFSDANDFSFFFVGNFEIEDFKKMLITYLATLPVKAGEESWKDPGVQIKEGKISKNFYKGQEPKALVRLTYRGDMKWNAKERRHVKALSEVLRIMLVESLREEKGGVYSPGANSSYQKDPESKYNITASFFCAPENVDDLIETVFKDVKSLQTQGPSEEILQKVKEAQKKSYQIGMKENGYWMSQLVFAYENDLDPTRVLDVEEGIESLSVKSLKKAAKKYFNEDELMRLVLLPEDQE